MGRMGEEEDWKGHEVAPNQPPDCRQLHEGNSQVWSMVGCPKSFAAGGRRVQVNIECCECECDTR